MQDEREEFVATLVQPAEYAHHLNQVAGLTTRNIVFLERKFVSRSGHELVGTPLDACVAVRYVDERSPLTIVSGVLLAGLVAFVLYMLAASWKRLEPGTLIPIGALALAGLYGVRRVFGARRHRLVFRLKDGTSLRWRSRPGDFDLKKANVERIVDFARARGILDTSRLTRT